MGRTRSPSGRGPKARSLPTRRRDRRCSTGDSVRRDLGSLRLTRLRSPARSRTKHRRVRPAAPPSGGSLRDNGPAPMSLTTLPVRQDSRQLPSERMARSSLIRPSGGLTCEASASRSLRYCDQPNTPRLHIQHRQVANLSRCFPCVDASLVDRCFARGATRGRWLPRSSIQETGARRDHDAPGIVVGAESTGEGFEPTKGFLDTTHPERFRDDIEILSLAIADHAVSRAGAWLFICGRARCSFGYRVARLRPDVEEGGQAVCARAGRPDALSECLDARSRESGLDRRAGFGEDEPVGNAVARKSGAQLVGALSEVRPAFEVDGDGGANAEYLGRLGGPVA